MPTRAPVCALVIAEAVDNALKRALDERFEPQDAGSETIGEILAAYGIPEDMVRPLMLSACNVYEREMRGARAAWSSGPA